MASRVRMKEEPCSLCGGLGVLRRPASGSLRSVRQAAGLTLGDVSRATGYSLTYLSDIERDLRRPPLQIVDAYRELGAPVKQRSSSPQHDPAELAWRIDEVWRVHLVARKRWHELHGRACREPKRTAEIAKAIRAQLLEHDAGQLDPDHREAWTRESPVRAAGIGLFLDPWCTGEDPDNDATGAGKLYLEPWRPWKRQAGKADPVERFAALFFDYKAQNGR